MGENLPDETMGNQQAMDIVWLAGIMDGEGSIQLNFNRSWRNPENMAMKVRVSFANGDERLILRCVNILESLGMIPYVVGLPPTSHQTLWRWQASIQKMDDALTLCRLMLPHLTAKRDRAFYTIKYLESRIKDQFIFGGTQPGTTRHKATRRAVTADEQRWASLVAEHNKALSPASTTAREGARQTLLARQEVAKAKLKNNREERKRLKMDNANTLKRDRRALRKIQSGLHGDMQRPAEMTGPSAENL